MNYTVEDINLMEDWWIQKSRVNFLAYRQYMRSNNFINGWFISDVCKNLQQFYLDFKAGKRPVLIMQSPPQHGKLIADHVPVLTINGWKKHGELKVGDKIFHPSGETTSIVWVGEKDKANTKVEFTNGDYVFCHDNHEWNVYSRDLKRTITIETMGMLNIGKRTKRKNPLFNGIEGKRGSRYIYQLPLVSPIVGKEMPLAVDPYVLGVWLGDGTQTKPAITYAKKDSCIIEEVEKRGYNLNNTYIHKTTGVLTSYFTNLKTGLIDIDVFAKRYGIRKKHIPDQYLTSTISNRLQLLAGLIDTDGYVYPKNGRYVFTTSDHKLSESFCHLISSFGWNFSKVIEQPKISSSGIVGKKEYYVIGFNPTMRIPCIVSRKKHNASINQRKIAIKKITQNAGNFIGNCIQVDSPDGLYLVGKTMQPTHNSWSVIDFLAWVSGLNPALRSIYASYSDTLGIRCNTQLQRFFDSEKHQKIFPGHRINTDNVVTQSNKPKRNSRHIEFTNKDGIPTGGQFRNTTVQGSVTGESLDIGVIDDAVKGREQANSIVYSEKTWAWLLDDFMDRFSDMAGLIIIMTRWSTHDIIGRLIDKYKETGKQFKLFNYQAIATKDEPHRKEGEALFHELKSLEFLKEKKALKTSASWESLYQGNPTVTGGNVIKDEWWSWWKVLPKILYKFITVDTAQKDKKQNDWTCFQCWGMGIDGRIYLLDKFREKLQAPALRREAELFYKKHDTQKINPDDPILRKMYIEDKSSGIGLIQELKLKRMKIKEVPRNTDKFFRAEDCSPYIESGQVVLNVDIPGVGNITKEAREFPNGEFDDDFDTLMTAIEVSFINKQPQEFVA